ncbi:MAG: hypothetical protein LBD13_02230 [Spirochaetaceae bacterium]|nr:hypothetical protein [Spirochaetaceae bacterium]
MQRNRETLGLKTIGILAPARGVQPETVGIIVIASIVVRYPGASRMTRTPRSKRIFPTLRTKRN